MTTTKLTIKSAKSELADLGINLGKTAGGDFRVRYPDAAPGEGYFTNDLADALATGKQMAIERDAAIPAK
jgi:hypothetical protein